MDSDGFDARIHKMQTFGLKFCWRGNIGFDGRMGNGDSGL